MTSRRGVVLPAVLFVLILVGLLSAVFVFRVNADLATSRAVAAQLQTRLAAESAIERVLAMLAETGADFAAWYDNPEQLHRIVVWSSDGDSSSWGTNTEQLDDGASTYRFSVIADDPLDDDGYVRFGLTDESSRVYLNNQNLALLEKQLLTLVTAAAGEGQDIIPQQIVNAILDWRDADSTPRGEDGDTEAEFYANLDRPYQVKNGLFSTVEELLLVKGVTKELLYGEDFDRNGILTNNEDDGFDTFPVDNEDNVLNRGLYPYLTVLAYETNFGGDGQPLIYLRGEQNKVRSQLEEVFPDEPELVTAIITHVQAQSGNQGGRAGQQPQGTDPTGQDVDNNAENQGELSPEGDPNIASPDPTVDPKSRSRQQVRPSDEQKPDDNAGDNAENEGEDQPPPDSAENTEEPEQEEQRDEESDADEESDNSGGAAPQTGPIQSQVSLLLRTELIGVEHLEALLERTTLIPPGQRLVGRINVNTAPPLVLRCIDGLTEEQVDNIVAARSSLPADRKRTYAWLATEEVLDLETLERIAPQITSRGQQFTIEALGYSDHSGAVTRLQVVVDMAGLVPQPIYYRDISYLGARYPLREEDLDNFSVR